MPYMVFGLNIVFKSQVNSYCINNSVMTPLKFSGSHAFFALVIKKSCYSWFVFFLDVHIIIEQHQPCDPHIQLSDSFYCCDKELYLLIIIIWSINRKPYHLDLVAPWKISLCFSKFYLCTFLKSNFKPVTYFTRSSWNLLWKLTTLTTSMILLCSIKLLTYKCLMQIYLFLSKLATFRRHFGITKEEQGLYTTLQGLAF